LKEQQKIQIDKFLQGTVLRHAQDIKGNGLTPLFQEMMNTGDTIFFIGRSGSGKSTMAGIFIEAARRFTSELLGCTL